MSQRWVQSSCRSRLHTKCAAEVKTNDAKQSEAGTNGKADKEPEYYEVGLCSSFGLSETALFSSFHTTKFLS